MKSLIVIVGIAGAIRLATAVDPRLTAIVVGAIAIGAAAYGLWSNRRSHWLGWLVSWGLISAGLTANVGAVVAERWGGDRISPASALPLALTLTGGVLTLGGLGCLLHERLPVRLVESLAAAVVSTGALAFPLLALVVVPSLGWHPGRELSAVAAPLTDVVVLWLAVSVVSMTRRHPVAYRYLVAALGCVFVAHALAAATSLAGYRSSPVPLDAVLLWGLCLWSCSVLHPSQRQSLDPIPLRSSRPGWIYIGLMVVGALVAPAVLSAKALLGIHNNVALFAAGSGVLPLLIVMYLTYQVYTRSAAEYRAQHDPLTGVCNRTLFNDRVESALMDSRRSGNSVGVLFIDLDRFKSINDSLGHAVGNQLLQAVVARLQSRLRPRDTLARMGGDEFTILVPDLDGKATAANLAERILGAFSEPFHVGGKLLPVQASLGVAVSPDDGDCSETLFKNADTAMYQAKGAGRNTYAVYNSAMSARAELRFALESSLRTALERERLSVHYQPKLSTVSGRIVGVEALARWRHPRLGFIPPAAFIPLAEETTLISSLGEWVLETACLQARAWQEQGLPRLSVSVNVSPRQFVRQSVVRLVADVLDRTGLDPTLLELEVTESVLVEQMQDTAASLAELRSMGVRCSIDDFGTGYSALTYLTDMPVDAIKIDPSFVRRIDARTGAAPIVGAVIDLAHSLDLQVIAEGVETDAQLAFLSDHSCDQVQGYLFSPPLPADELEAYLRDPSGLLVEEGARAAGMGEVPAAVAVPQARLSAILSGLSQNGTWLEQPTQEDLLAILAALQSDELITIVGPRGLRRVPARMAVGTLAGLASLTGGVGAAANLPSVRQLAGEILQQATGLGLPDAPDHGSGSGLLRLAVGAGTSAGSWKPTTGADVALPTSEHLHETTPAKSAASVAEPRAPQTVPSAGTGDPASSGGTAVGTSAPGGSGSPTSGGSNGGGQGQSGGGGSGRPGGPGTGGGQGKGGGRGAGGGQGQGTGGGQGQGTGGGQGQGTGGGQGNGGGHGPGNGATQGSGAGSGGGSSIGSNGGQAGPGGGLAGGQQGGGTTPTSSAGQGNGPVDTPAVGPAPPDGQAPPTDQAPPTGQTAPTGQAAPTGTVPVNADTTQGQGSGTGQGQSPDSTPDQHPGRDGSSPSPGDGQPPGVVTGEGSNPSDAGAGKGQDPKEGNGVGQGEGNGQNSAQNQGQGNGNPSAEGGSTGHGKGLA